MALLRNKKFLAYLVIYSIVVFLGGVIISKLIVRTPFPPPHPVMGRSLHKGSFNKTFKRHKKRFMHRLQLSEQQEEQLKPVLDRFKQKLDIHRQKNREEMDQFRIEFQEEIKTILDQDQIKKFKRMHRKFEGRRRRHKPRL